MMAGPQLARERKIRQLGASSASLRSATALGGAASFEARLRLAPPDDGFLLFDLSPSRRALFGEGGEAFGGFGGAALVGMGFDQAALSLFAEIGPGRLQRQRLGLGHRLRAVLQQLIDDARAGGASSAAGTMS